MQTFKHNTLISDAVMQVYLINICPKLPQCLEGTKITRHMLVDRRNMHALFSVCSLRDDNVITSEPT